VKPQATTPSPIAGRWIRLSRLQIFRNQRTTSLQPRTQQLNNASPKAEEFAFLPLGLK
jgi:hypothetical protein